MLSPVIFFNVLMNVVGAFQAFNTAYIVSNGTGGPADATLFYTLYSTNGDSSTSTWATRRLSAGCCC